MFDTPTPLPRVEVLCHFFHPSLCRASFGIAFAAYHTRQNLQTFSRSSKPFWGTFGVHVNSWECFLSSSDMIGTCRLPGRPHVEGSICSTSSEFLYVCCLIGLWAMEAHLLILDLFTASWNSGKTLVSVVLLMVKSGKTIFSSCSELLFRKKSLFSDLSEVIRASKWRWRTIVSTCIHENPKTVMAESGRGGWCGSQGNAGAAGKGPSVCAKPPLCQAR